jgi:REP element-mobilizing transposase RayT
MGSTFFSLHYHIVFSTKERRPLIRAEWRPRLHSYLGGIIRRMNGVAETVGGVDDHVHLMARLRPVHCLADVMRDLKKDSTNWVKANFDRSFAWQEGYAAFTVSPSATDAVRNYIANQESHHDKRSFVDELKELLGKAGVAYEKKYLL